MSRVQALLVPALSALFGGAVGALVTVSLLPSAKAPRPAASAAAEERNADAPSDVEDRIAALERSLERLRGRVALQPLGAAAPGASGAAASSGSAPQAEVAPLVDNPVFEAAVLDVMDRAEQARRADREAERSEWRKQMAQQWAGDLSGKLKLTDAQKAKLEEIASTFMERVRELRESDAGPPASRDEWRSRVGALREQAETDIGKTLDASQMGSYRELPEEERLGMRVPFRRGGGGGGRDRERFQN